MNTYTHVLLCSCMYSLKCIFKEEPTLQFFLLFLVGTAWITKPDYSPHPLPECASLHIDTDMRYKFIYVELLQALVGIPESGVMFADVIVLHWHHTDAAALATAASEGSSAQVCMYACID